MTSIEKAITKQWKDIRSNENQKNNDAQWEAMKRIEKGMKNRWQAIRIMSWKSILEEMQSNKKQWKVLKK